MGLHEIRQYFVSKLSSSEESRRPDAVAIAACALLLEIAHADAVFSEPERERILRAVREDLGVPEEEVAQIVRLAEAEIRWKFAEDQRVAEATVGAREEIERLVEARLHRELAVGARKSVARSHRATFAVGRLLRTMAALIAVAVAGLATYQYFPEIRQQLEPTAPAAVAAQPDPKGKTPSEVATGSVLFAAEFANMRAEPSSTARIVSTVDKGAKLVELDRSRGWVKVAPHDGSGAQGWVHGSLLQPAPPPSR